MAMKPAVKQTVVGNANAFYPKFVINHKTKEARMVESGAVTLGTDETFFFEPPDKDFGSIYEYMVYPSSDGTFLMKYIQPNMLYNTTSGSTLDYRYHYRKPLSLSTNPNNFHVYQLTGSDNLITAFTNSTIPRYNYTYMNKPMDMGSVYLSANALYAVDKTSGNILWDQQDWDNNGTPYTMGSARVVVDIDKAWVFNFDTNLHLVTDVTTGSFITADLSGYGTYNDMFALPDGSVLLCPSYNAGGDIARASYENGQIVIDNTFGAGSNLTVDWSTDIQGNVGHALDGSAYYVSNYDYIFAYSMTDGSLLWVYHRNNSSNNETFHVHPVTGNIFCDENMYSGTSFTDCDIVEIDKTTGTAVHTQHFSTFDGMGISAMASDGTLFVADTGTVQRRGFLDVSTTPWVFTDATASGVTGGLIAYETKAIVAYNDIAYFPASPNHGGGVVIVDFPNKLVDYVELVGAGKRGPGTSYTALIGAEDDSVLFISGDNLPYRMSLTDLGLPNEVSPNTVSSYSPAGLTEGYYASGDATWGPPLRGRTGDLGVYGSAKLTGASSSSPAYSVVMLSDSGQKARAVVAEIYDGTQHYKGAIDMTGVSQYAGPVGTDSNGNIVMIGDLTANPTPMGIIDPVNLTYTSHGSLPAGMYQQIRNGTFGYATNSGDFVYFATSPNGTHATYVNGSGTTTWTAATKMPPASITYVSPVYDSTNDIFYVLGFSSFSPYQYMYSYVASTDTWTALTAPTIITNGSDANRPGTGAFLDSVNSRIIVPSIGQIYDISGDSWSAAPGWTHSYFLSELRYITDLYLGNPVVEGSTILYTMSVNENDTQAAYAYP